MEITHETREQIRAASAVENDELLAVHDAVGRARERIAERESDRKRRWRRK